MAHQPEPAALIQRAMQHINDDHGHNLLEYAQRLAGLNWAEEAEMSSLDLAGFDLVVRGSGRIHHVRLTFDASLASAEQLRPALVALAQRARHL